MAAPMGAAPDGQKSNNVISPISCEEKFSFFIIYRNIAMKRSGNGINEIRDIQRQTEQAGGHDEGPGPSCPDCRRPRNPAA